MVSPVEAFQNPWELRQLMLLVDDLRPQSILEVGAMYGGTLWHWLVHSPKVVVVDDEMRNADEWDEWAMHAESELYLLQGSSHDSDLIAKAQELGPYDFAFIDGDHSYAAVRADWENFGPLASVVAFHDILPRPGYGVSELWASLKADGAQWVEICHNATLPGNEGPTGIGVLWT